MLAAGLRECHAGVGMTTPDFFREKGPGLVQLGYEIVPIRPGEKRPAGGNGWQKRDFGPAASHGRKYGNHGVGIKTAKTPVVDIDIIDEEIANLMADFTEGVIGATVKRVGQWPKLGLLYRTKFPFPKVTSKAYKDRGGQVHRVEILGDGQQCVAFHIHPDTKEPYTWPNGEPENVTSLPEITQADALEITQEFTRLVAEKRPGWQPVSEGKQGQKKQLPPEFAYYVPTDFTQDQVEEMLARLDPDMGRDDWITVGMALHSTGEPWAFDVWDAWSAKGQKYNRDDISKQWASFSPAGGITMGSLVHMAKEVESVQVYDSIDSVPDNEPDRPVEHDFEFPDGLVGEVADYVMASSPVPNKPFALMAGLLAVSLLSRNRYHVPPFNTRLNLYVTAVGETASGKDAPPRAVGSLAINAGAEKSVVEGVASGVALLRALNGLSDHCMFYWQDEIWEMIQAASMAKGSIHKKELTSILMTLYGRAGSSIGGRVYADEKMNIEPIDHPFVVFGGATTPVRFMEAISDKHVADGFLNRMIVFQSCDKPIRQPPAIDQPPSALMESLGMLYGGPIRCDEKEGKLVPRAHNVAIKRSAGVDEHFTAFDEKCSNKGGEFAALWSRGFENSIKVAGILAVGVDYENPIITMDQATRATRLIDDCLSGFDLQLAENLAESEFHAQCNKAMKTIRDAYRYRGDKRWGDLTMKGMPKALLTRVMHLKSAAMKDIIQHLVESDRIEVFEVDKKTMYRVRK